MIIIARSFSKYMITEALSFSKAIMNRQVYDY